jgi:predicted lipoprotein with Yx(FWY)xxD motif
MRTRLMAAPMLGLAVLLAACSSGAASPAAPASAAPASAAASEAPASAPAPEAATVNLADTTLGKVLVDGKGMTLYVFTPDNASDSTCYDKCEASWPVLKGASVTAGAGLTAADFGATTRKDGTAQVTFKKWPLYTFAGDTAAGETKGQGLGGKWYVVDANGTMVGKDAAASPAASAASATGPAINLGSTTLGDILTDGKGMTLYMFTADADGKSACTGDCLANWPAVKADGAPVLGTGLDAEDFTTITRDDGAKQLAFYGMPLYTFAGDTASGDTKGQGLGGKWYVLKGDGSVVK